MKKGLRFMKAAVSAGLALAIFAPTAAAAYYYYDDYFYSEETSVEHHTQDEIKAKYIELGLNSEWKTEYAEEPSVSSPYSAGSLTDESLTQALNMVNFVRYTAGLPSVELDDTYNYYAQCASLVIAVNGRLSHYPSQPSDMDYSLYEDGALGASKSNLGSGYSSIADSIVNGYMEDSDSSNIDRVGHRRWILNPTMGKIGFGYVPSGYSRYTATYAVDKSGEAGDYDYVAWPPENMPMELYNSYSSNYAFSVSVGSNYDLSSLKNAVVTISVDGTDTSWTISQNDGDDSTYFNAETSYYGTPGCIIFDTGKMFESGDKVNVSISNITKNGEPAEINYSVSFFTMCPDIDDCEISEIKAQTYTGKAIKPDVSIKFEGKELTKGVDYTLSYSNNTEVGTASVTINGIGEYKGSKTLRFDINPGKAKLTKIVIKKKGFTAKWKKQTGVDYYEIQYSTKASMKNAKTVKVYGEDNISKTITGLKSKTKYYVRVRAVAWDYPANAYGAWSKAIGFKVK